MSVTERDIVSICLTSDGHSFLEQDALSRISDARCAEVLMTTAKVALVPASHLRSTDPKSHLAQVGIAATEQERVLLSKECNGRVAVMLISAALYDNVEPYIHKLSFTSPLLEGDMPERGVEVSLYGKTLFVRVMDGGLRFAEAVSIASDADILYYVEAVSRVYAIYNNMYARVKGDTDRLYKLLKTQFRKLVCE